MNNIEITPKELKSLLTQKNNIILLDVRTKKEIEIDEQNRENGKHVKGIGEHKSGVR